jgi:hypothetical protein
MKLKRLAVSIFCQDAKITQNNRNNMHKLINGIKIGYFKKELLEKLENHKKLQ